MDLESIRDFARRDRAEVQAAKQRFWAEEYRRFGPARTVAVSQALWQYTRRLRGDWPTAGERAEDLAHHVALKAKLDRAGHALAAR